MRTSHLLKFGVTGLWALSTAANTLAQVTPQPGLDAQPYRLSVRQQKVDGDLRCARVASQHHLQRADGSLNVSIRFDQDLTAEERSDYETQGVRFRRLPSGRIAGAAGIYAAWVTPAGLDALADDPRVLSVEGGSTRTVQPPMDLSRAEVQADLRHATRTVSNISGNTGRGVTVGVVDTGIDIFHPDFFTVRAIAPYAWIDVDGNGFFSPGVDAVDLNRNGSAEANEKLNFVERWADTNSAFNVYDCDTDWLYADANNNGNRDFGRAAGFDESDDTYGERLFLTNDNDGDDRLTPGDTLQPLGASKVRKVLFGDREYVRGVDLIDAPIDTNGHGTAVCSIVAAGSAGYNRLYAGIAPEAELVVVDRYSFDADTAQERSDNYVSMLLWMEDQGADVMLWEFGGWVRQFMDGSSHLEALISNRQLIGYSAQVIPNGNLGASGRHAQADIAAGQRAARAMTIPAALTVDRLDMSVVCHAANAGTSMLVELKNGDAGYALLPGNAQTQIDGYTVACSYSQSTRGTLRYDITIVHPDGDAIDEDNWTVRVRNTGSSTETFHFYCRDDATTWSGGVAWDNPVDSHLVTWPATADVCIGVASYSTRGGDFAGDVPGVISPFSSPGPRVDGAAIEAVAAPGDYGDVICAQTQAINPVGAWGGLRGFGGTSAAGPHVAGAAALLFEAVPVAGAMDVREALFSSAAQDAFTGATPNERWGWGKLRVDDAYYQLAGERCQVIEPVALQTPQDGASGHDPSQALLFNWMPQPEADLYDLHFGTSNPPQRYVPGLYGAGFTMAPSAFEENTTYYYQVVAYNSCGYVSKSEVRTLTTGEIYVPQPNLQVYEQELVNNQFVRTAVPHGGSYAYPAVAVGSQTAKIFALYNEGDADLGLLPGNKVTLSGPGAEHFTVTYTPVENGVAAGNWVPTAILFKPQASGTHFCQVVIGSDDPDGAYIFGLSALALPGSDDAGDSGNDPSDPNEGNSDPNEPQDEDDNDPVDPGDDEGETGGDDDDTIAEPNTPTDLGDIVDDHEFDPNEPLEDVIDPGNQNQQPGEEPGDQQGEQDAIEVEIDEELLEEVELLPSGLCGFGAGFASMMCSLAYAGRGLRRRRR